MKNKKELKEAYKNAARPMGIYQIRNLTNGKLFVGAAMDLNQIWNSQKFQLELSGHKNEALQHDWNTLGPHAFVFEKLHEILPKEGEGSARNPREELAELEALTLAELQPYGAKGYNKQPKEA